LTTSTPPAIPAHAFILAAGKGERLRPYTNTIPKPMVSVGGMPLVDHVLNAVETVGVHDVTLNLHYLAPVLQNHLLKRASPRLTFSFEQELLDTGGGIKKALYTMGGQPFFCLSGDMLWEDGPSGDTLGNLAAGWDDHMDLLLLLQPVENMKLTSGSGDYDITPQGHVVRNKNKTGKFFWPSLRICHPRLFENTAEFEGPNGAFSFLHLMDRAERQGRLGAVVHDGICHHISTPADLDRVNAHLTPQKKGAKMCL